VIVKILISASNFMLTHGNQTTFALARIQVVLLYNHYIPTNCDSGVIKPKVFYEQKLMMNWKLCRKSIEDIQSKVQQLARNMYYLHLLVALPSATNSRQICKQ